MPWSEKWAASELAGLWDICTTRGSSLAPTRAARNTSRHRQQASASFASSVALQHLRLALLSITHPQHRWVSSLMSPKLALPSRVAPTPVPSFDVYVGIDQKFLVRTHI